MVKADLDYLENTLSTVEAHKYFIEFKSNEDQRIGYMPLSNFNLIQHQEIKLSKDEFIAAAGNRGEAPIINTASDLFIKSFKLASTHEQNLLSTGFQQSYFIVPDDIYKTIDYMDNFLH